MNFNFLSRLSAAVYKFLLYIQSLLEEKEVNPPQLYSSIRCPNCQYGEIDVQVSLQTSFLQCPHCSANYFRIGHVIYPYLLADQKDNPEFKEVLTFANVKTRLAEFGIRLEISAKSASSNLLSEETTFDLFEQNRLLFKEMPLRNCVAFLECYKLAFLREIYRR